MLRYRLLTLGLFILVIFEVVFFLSYKNLNLDVALYLDVAHRLLAGTPASLPNRWMPLRLRRGSLASANAHPQRSEESQADGGPRPALEGTKGGPIHGPAGINPR